MSAVRFLPVLFVFFLALSEAQAQSHSLRDPDVAHPEIRGVLVR